MWTRRGSTRARCLAGLIAVPSIVFVASAAAPGDVPVAVPAAATATLSAPPTVSRSPSPGTAVEPAPAAAAAAAAVRPVTAAELGATWRPGCPVPPALLRRIDLNYVGFDGRPHRGALVVHRDLVPEVIAIFDQLFRLHFPIQRMQTVDRYPGGSDELSMADDNTSAFNCRPLPGGGQWSLHAFGRAIDLNPRRNPFVDRRGLIQPGNARPFLDRTRSDPGLLHADDPVVRAFTGRGWRWGGSWRTPVDYQHFERR